MDATQFRTDFPEFTDTGLYPDSMINFYLGLATVMVNPCRWKTMTDKGIELYTAHEITIAAQDKKTATNGGMPGQRSGQPNSKTVGSVTVGFDSTSAAEKDAGWWNTTTYGKQFYRLMRMMGAGAIQL